MSSFVTANILSAPPNLSKNHHHLSELIPLVGFAPRRSFTRDDIGCSAFIDCLTFRCH